MSVHPRNPPDPGRPGALPADPGTADPPTSGTPGATAGIVALFAERVRAAGGSVTQTPATELAEAVASLVVADGVVAVTPELAGLAGDLRRHGVDACVAARGADPPDARGRTLEDVLRAAGAGVTGGAAGVAASGTVAVGPGGGNGGLLMALPPHHVVVLPRSLVVATLAEALAVVASRFDEWDGEVVFVTGPSRTADIEMLSVIGVHGPLRLDVVLVEDAPGGGEGAAGVGDTPERWVGLP